MTSKFYLISYLVVQLIAFLNAEIVSELNQLRGDIIGTGVVRATVARSEVLNGKENERLTLECSASSAKEGLEIIWYKDQRLVKDDFLNIRQNNNYGQVGSMYKVTSLLEIDSLQAIHAGKYKCYCYAEDKLYIDEREMRLIVAEAALLTVYAEIDEGEYFAISCPELVGFIQWTKDNGPYFGEIVNDQVIIRRASLQDSGLYTCSANRRKNIQLTVRRRQCAANEATCRNGQCIDKSRICDGRADCNDGGDEVGCAVKVENCDPTKWYCRNLRDMKEKMWFCDGERDCPDGSDEENCPSRRPESRCETTQFLCNNGQQCISKGFVCDQQNDCSDNSDEFGCVIPQVTVPPVRTLDVCVGETIDLNCRADAFPVPFVNWRLNWGCICNESRCEMTNDNGYGRLIIRDARLYDSGAYSCEAMSSMGRVIYPIDAIVTVRECFRPPPPPPVEIIPELNCNPRGTRRREPRNCICHDGYTGLLCDRCATDAFMNYFTQECIPCFCNGLEGVTCQASTLLYNRENSFFNNEHHQWNVISADNVQSSSVSINTKIGALVHTENSGSWFFVAGPTYRGNKILSYGGNLSFEIFYEGETDYSNDGMKLEIRFEGNQLSFVHKYPELIYPYEEKFIVIPVIESFFKRYPDGGDISRDHFLMALENVNKIMITASFVPNQHSAYIRNFGLDFAKVCNDTYRAVQSTAYLVEICRCSQGYNGTSCEICSSGYNKNIRNGQYLGLCSKSCESMCNGHSEECTESECTNCQHNTEGRFCDRCQEGYQGDPTQGECELIDYN